MTLPRLGIDTATPYLALALVWPDEERSLIAAWRLDRGLAADLAPRIAAFMATAGLTPRSLGGLGVGVGPGSYTGARVGVAWALAVGRALGAPVVGGDTMAARALATVPAGSSGWVAVEARRGEAWLQPWAWSDGSLTARDEARQVRLTELPADAAASLVVPPAARWHAHLVDGPGAEAPTVRYAAPFGNGAGPKV